MTASGTQTPRGSAGCFVTTHWSVVLTAGGSEPSRARAALEQLCRNYWHPLYAYVRGTGHSREEAEDGDSREVRRLNHHPANPSCWHRQEGLLS